MGDKLQQVHCACIFPPHTHIHVIQTHTFTIYTVTRLTRCARRCVYHDQLSKTNPNLPSRCRCCRRRGSCIERARERNLTNSTSERARAKLNSQRVSRGRESEEERERYRERSGSKPAKQQQQSE